MSAIDPRLVLQAARQTGPTPPQRLHRDRLGHQGVCVLGAGGHLGSAMVEQALAQASLGTVEVVTLKPLSAAPKGLQALVLPASGGVASLVTRCATAIVVFDVARSRESGFYMPDAAALLGLARQLKACGVRGLAVVLPHAPAMLPTALREGLWSLDETELAAMGFERLLFVRPAAADGARASAAYTPGWRGVGERVAAWMLGNLHWMMATQHRPVRAHSVAAFVLEVLKAWDEQAMAQQAAGDGDSAGAPQAGSVTRVASAELVWAAAQPGQLQAVVAQWLSGRLPEIRAPAPLR